MSTARKIAKAALHPDGVHLGLAVANTDYAQAFSNLNGRISAQRVYLQTDDISTIQNTIESYLSATPAVLPIVSGKWNTQAEFETIASQLAAFNTPSRFVLAVHHEPYDSNSSLLITPDQYVQDYGWLMDAIDQGDNNLKVVPAFIMNGFAYGQGGAQRKNKLDTVYGDGTPGSGIQAYMPPTLVTRFNGLDGVMCADFYDDGVYPNAGNGPAIAMMNCYNYWQGVPYIDNLGITVTPSPVQVHRFGAGEIGSFDPNNADAALRQLLNLKYLFGCWWDHDAQYMWLSSTATANSVYAPQMLQSYVTVYQQSTYQHLPWRI